MNPDSKRWMVPLLLLLGTSHTIASAGRIEHLDSYRQQGIVQTDAERGRRLWYATNGERGCTTCHGELPAETGRHVKTGKTIEPMAPSVNPGRYRSAEKIEKWFLRNCNWTFGRECSKQEKADILTWLAGQ